MRQEAGHVASLRQQASNAREWSLSCIELVQCCTDLIDELQRERGLGQLLLGSVGESYASALREQLQLSAEAEQALRRQLLRLEALPATTDPSQLELLRLGLALLNSPGLADLLPMRRELLLQRCAREQMFEAYCSLLAQLLELVEAAAQAIQEPAPAQELATLLPLMWAKEYSGQERASGAGLYASACHEARVWQRIEQLIEAQQRCASAFISRARPAARKRLKDSLQLETQAELEQLRQQLADSVDQAALDPGQGELWFRGCSRRMNELREVERSLLQEMLQSLAPGQAGAATVALVAAPRATRLAPGAVETVLRTATAWLAAKGPGYDASGGRPA